MARCCIVESMELGGLCYVLFKLLFPDSTLGAATELEFFGGRKGNDYLNEIRKEKTRSRRSKKKERSAAAWSVVVTEVVDGNDNYEANFEAKQQQRSQAEAKMEAVEGRIR